MGLISSIIGAVGNIGSSAISGKAQERAANINASAVRYANDQNVALQRETNAQMQRNWEQERYDSQHEFDYRINALRRNGFSAADPSMAGAVNAPSGPQLTAPQVEPVVRGDPAAGWLGFGKGLSDSVGQANGIITQMLQQDLLKTEIEGKEITNSLLADTINTKNDQSRSQADYNRSQTERNDKQAQYEARMFPVQLQIASSELAKNLASVKLTDAQRKKVGSEIDKLNQEAALLRKEVSTFDDYRQAQIGTLLEEINKKAIESQHLSQQQQIRAIETVINVIEKRGDINGQSASMVKNIFRSAYNIKADLDGSPTAVDIFDAAVSPILMGVTSSVQ